MITTYPQHYKRLLQIGIPIVIGQIGMIILGFADTLMIGWYGKNELAAAGFVNNMFNIGIIFATGFSYGLTPIVGSAYGQGEKKMISSALRNSLYANMIIAVFLCLLFGILYLNIGALGQPEELLPLIRPYFLVLLASIPFILFFNAFKQFADGITDTKIPMWILLGGNAFNIIFNYLLIYGKWGFPEWGLLGAGVATLGSRILMCVMAVIVFHTSRYKEYSRNFWSSIFDKAIFTRLNKLGWSVGLQMGMESAAFNLSTLMIGWLGVNALAANQIMLTISQVTFMMYYGMGAAVSVQTSYYYGSAKVKETREVAMAGFHIILLMIVIAIIPLFSLREQIGSLFTNDADVIQMVSYLIFPFVVYQIGDGLQIIYANALRGIADVKKIIVHAFIAFFMVSLPLGYFFGFILEGGITGVWMAYPIGLSCAGILFYNRFRKTTEQTLKKDITSSIS
ncbi:MAG: MATE family efflux transporter [Prevotellaceae bacterium]|nr:MATE family efflux transporter [Prevotellaceae bacterium]